MRTWMTSLVLFVFCVGCSPQEEFQQRIAATESRQKELLSKEAAEPAPPTEPDFPHLIVVETEYYTTGPQQARSPDGKFTAGTEIKVIEEAGSYLLVRSKEGIEGYVAHDAVTQLNNGTENEPESAEPEPAPVEGKVLLDGKPVSGATVEFAPDNGQPSSGKTDKDGRFKLEEQKEKQEWHIL